MPKTLRKFNGASSVIFEIAVKTIESLSLIVDKSMQLCHVAINGESATILKSLTSKQISILFEPLLNAISVFEGNQQKHHMPLQKRASLLLAELRSTLIYLQPD
jgi:hypothetical protein